MYYKLKGVYTHTHTYRKRERPYEASAFYGILEGLFIGMLMIARKNIFLFVIFIGQGMMSER